MSTSNPHNEWLKAKKRWDLLDTLAEKDLPLKAWAKAAGVDVKTLLKHRGQLVKEGAVETYRKDGITYYHLKTGATLARASPASPPEPEYLVRQTPVPEARKLRFKGKIPADGRTVRKSEIIQSKIVIGRPYWKVYGEEKLAEFRRENGWPTLTRQEMDQWLAKIHETAEFSVGPPGNDKVPNPGLKDRLKSVSRSA